MNIEEIQQSLKVVADGQAGHEARIGSLEAAFKSVAESLQLLIEMTTAHEERLDRQDEERIHTDARLDALIDSQIKLDERFAEMTARFDTMSANFAAMMARSEEHDRRIEQLFAAQSEHSAAIRALLERSGN